MLKLEDLTEKYFAVWVGGIEFMTGLMLIFCSDSLAPLLLLEEQYISASALLPWIGAFVGAIGLGYLWTSHNFLKDKSALKITILVRACVSLWLCFALALNRLPITVLFILLYDAGLCIHHLRVLFLLTKKNKLSKS